MCYILSIAVPKSISDIEAMFDADVSLQKLVKESIASAAIGAQHQQQAFAVTVNGCSCDLLVGGHRMPGKPELLTHGVKKLLGDVPAISLVNHWFTLPIDEVQIKCEKEESLTFAEFEKLYPRLEEDIRYLVTEK